jgi:3-methyladenine DNA glycosylase AlkC
MDNSDEEKFLLKDRLFTVDKVKKIATELKVVYPEFKDKLFVKQVLAEFPKLELMARVYWIRDCLREHLPEDYQSAVKVILESLPPPCDPSLSDDDFGSFIYSPYSYFVAEYGCTKKDLLFSLKALRQLTTRFSVEGPIRFFINEFPRETMAELPKWARDAHYHVRRLASEGTRPSLPWAKNIGIPYADTVEILNILHGDKTRYVTRSVANHLNDISKIDPDLVVKLLKVWHKLEKQDKKELDYMTKHALRTLVKDGNPGALVFLGYSAKDVVVTNFSIQTKKVAIGEAVEFAFDITSTSNKSQQLIIDYVLHFKKASGELAPKTQKISKKTLVAGETMSISKKHLLKVMTTRTLYPGVHKIDLQINGKKFPGGEFTLVK